MPASKDAPHNSGSSTLLSLQKCQFHVTLATAPLFDEDLKGFSLVQWWQEELVVAGRTASVVLPG